MSILVHRSMKVSMKVQHEVKEANDMLAFLLRGSEYRYRYVFKVQGCSHCAGHYLSSNQHYCSRYNKSAQIDCCLPYIEKKNQQCSSIIHWV